MVNVLRMARGAVVGGGGGGGATSFTVTGNSTGESAFSAFKPVILDRTMWRTPTVNTGDEAIYLHEEMAVPFSPAVTTWTITGSDAVYFQAGGSNGTIVFNTATRAGMSRRPYNLSVKATNANGDSTTQTLTVNVPATNKEYFISYGTGLNTTFDDGSFSKPWRHMPGSALFSGNSKTFTAGDVVFMKAEVHRTTHNPSLTSYTSSLNHAGASGNPHVVEMNGWGGRATMDGSDVITGWTSVTQAEVGGNTNYANIKKLDLTTQGGAIEWFQRIYDGNSMLYPAQFPTPNDIRVYELIDTNAQGTERYGLRNIPNQTSGGTSRMYTDGTAANSPGTTVTIVDPFIASSIGNITTSDPMFPQFEIYGPGNNVSRVSAATYDYATSTVTINWTSTLGVVSGNTAYAMTWSPKFIAKSGQVACSQDGNTLYAWLPNNTTTTIGRRINAVTWGQLGYVKYSGGQIQRYNSGTTRALVNRNCSPGFHWYGSNTFDNECDITNMWFYQNFAEDAGLAHIQSGSTLGTAGIKNSNITLCKLTENPGASFIRCGAVFNGVEGGTASQVRAGTVGKVQGNYVQQYGMGRTFLLAQASNGIHVNRNCVKDIATIHGNCVSFYDASASVGVINNVVDYNLFQNSTRGYTTNVSLATRSNTIEGNIFTNPTLPVQGASMGLFNGEPGGTITRNLVMGYDNTYTYTLSATFAPNGAAVSNNVFAGWGFNSGWTGSVTNNLCTVNTLSNDHLIDGGTQSGNVQLTGGSQVFYWDGTFSVAMQTALGSGPIGPFWTI